MSKLTQLSIDFPSSKANQQFPLILQKIGRNLLSLKVSTLLGDHSISLIDTLCPNLQYLKLSNLHIVSPTIADILNNLKHPRTLELQCCGISANMAKKFTRGSSRCHDFELQL